MIFFEGPMCETLKEQRRRGALRLDYLHGMRRRFLVKADEENLQRARFHHAKPCRIAPVGELFTKLSQRYRIALGVASSVNDVKESCALVLRYGREHRGVV